MSIRTFSASDAHHQFAILFVHGLAGSAAFSFGNWPKIVHDDTNPVIEAPYGDVKLSDFDIYLADYPTTETNYSIHEIGQALASRIEDHSLFKKYDMVWIVAHSLGGLVVHEAFTTLKEKNHDVYLRFVPAILELGVPGKGSKFADVVSDVRRLAGGTAVSLLERWLGYDPKLVAELNTSSDYLEALEAHWGDLVDSLRQSDGLPLVYCGYETKPETGIAQALGMTDLQVVNRLYTAGKCYGALRALPHSHIQLPKPADVDDDSHLLLRQMVRETLQSLSTRRYALEKRDTLYDALKAMADASQSKFSRDRATGLRLYKTRVFFVDSGKVTRSVKEVELNGWSMEDALRRAVNDHEDCLQLSSQQSDLWVRAKAGSICH